MMKRLLLTGFMCAAQLLNARSVLMEPRPAHVSFADKVHVYVHQVYAATPKNGVGQVLAKALFFTPQTSMKTVVSILNELGPHLIRDNTVADQEACSASLIKILVPIVAQFEQALFKGIHLIERSLEYWQNQEQHPVSYFFHKAPIKHFTFDQKKEVADKIAALKKMREQHFELLGRINIQLSTFDMQAPVQKQYSWIQKLGHVLFRYDETISVADDAEIFPLLYEATNLASNYKVHLHDRLQKYSMPGILTRRWVEVSALAAAAAYGASCELSQPGALWGILRKTFKSGKSTANEILGRPAEETVARGSATSSSAGKKEEGAEEPSYEKYLHYFSKMSDEKRREAKFTTQEIERELPSIILRKRLDEGRLKQGDYDEELKKVRNEYAKDHSDEELAEVAPSSLVGKMARYFQDEAFPGLSHVGDKGSELGAMFCDEDMSKWNWIAAVRKSLGQFLGSFSNGEFKNGDDPRLANSITGWYSMFSLRNALWKQEHPHLWGLIKTSPVTVPLTLISWNIYKMYRKKSRAFACDPIRIALVDIALLLNVYGDASPNEMEASDFGRLAYLAHKLELDINLVPKQYRESFLVEVGLLHTSSLNAKQKMKVIDLMYKKYPFLAFQGMMTA